MKAEKKKQTLPPSVAKHIDFLRRRNIYIRVGWRIENNIPRELMPEPDMEYLGPRYCHKPRSGGYLCHLRRLLVVLVEAGHLLNLKADMVEVDMAINQELMIVGPELNNLFSIKLPPKTFDDYKKLSEVVEGEIKIKSTGAYNLYCNSEYQFPEPL